MKWAKTIAAEETKMENIFSEKELAHMSSVMEANPVSPTDPEFNRTARKIANTDQVGSSLNTNTVSSRDLTDEYVDEGVRSLARGNIKGREYDPNKKYKQDAAYTSAKGYRKPWEKTKAQETAEKDKAVAEYKGKITKLPPGKAKLKEEEETFELDEGRGRPPKPGSAAWKRKHGSSSSETSDETTHQGRDPRQHIQVVAGQAAAGRHIDFKHNDGSTSKITPAMGRRITSHLNGLKPAERQGAVNKMHDSADGLKV
jgi:hypothetical protein